MKRGGRPDLPLFSSMHISAYTHTHTCTLRQIFGQKSQHKKLDKERKWWRRTAERSQPVHPSFGSDPPLHGRAALPYWQNRTKILFFPEYSPRPGGGSYRQATQHSRYDENHRASSAKNGKPGGEVKVYAQDFIKKGGSYWCKDAVENRHAPPQYLDFRPIRISYPCRKPSKFWGSCW